MNRIIRKVKGKLISIKNIIIISIITIIIVILSNISLKLQSNERLEINNNEIQDMKDKITVILSGEVKKPGKYELNKDSTMTKLLDISGGITDKADISNINLNKILLNKEKISIPSKQEEIEEDVKNNISDKININEANETELQTLPGIGKSTAKKIIDYRKNSEFEYIEDIKKVSGIGEAKYNAIKELITTE